MRRPLVIGHACAAGEAPANTLAGVRACLAARADAMEIDVRLSADGIPVLLHDETLDRTTTLQGPVWQYSAAELARADAGDGEPIPTLEHVLDAVQGQLTVMCELKSTPARPETDRALADAVAGVLTRYRADRWTAVHSFSVAMVERARVVAPSLSAAVISVPVAGETAELLLDAAVRSGAQAVSTHYLAVTPDFVVRAKRRQLTVWAWTPDTEAEWRALEEAGVDGIITNIPAALRRSLGAVADTGRI